MQLLDEDDVLRRCADGGQQMLDALETVRARYPQVVEEVRGRGMMVGIQLRDQSEANSHILRMLSQQGHLGYTAAAYMLNVHDIRLAPTLTQPFTLRLEPSAYVTPGELQRTADGIEMLCRAIASRDLAHLTAFRFAPTARVADYSQRRRAWKSERPRTEERVAFLGHLLVAEDIAQLEPSLASLEPAKLEAYLEDSSRLIEPCIFDELDVQSQTGAAVHLSFVGLTLTSRQIARALQGPDHDWIMEKLESSVALARDHGNQVVGFGGFTSIISANCRRVRTGGIGVTTGNSLTTGMGVRAVRQAADELGIDMAGATLAVIGATGNIASTYATMIAPSVKELVLVVRSVTSPKIRPLLAKLRAVAPQVRGQRRRRHRRDLALPAHRRRVELPRAADLSPASRRRSRGDLRHLAAERRLGTGPTHRGPTCWSFAAESSGCRATTTSPSAALRCRVAMRWPACPRRC